MRKKLVSSACVLSLAAVACGDGDPGGPDGEVGSLRAAVEISGSRHDVTGIRLNVVAADSDCDSAPLFSEVVEVEDETLPASLAGTGSHAFGDGLFVLEPGSYRVCATPLAGDEASAECGPASELAEVAAGLTTEIVLFSQCDSDQNGGLDAVVALNDQPEISLVELDPSKFISVCETLSLVATATDPNDDALSYAWSIVSGPEGASLHADDASASFSGPAGDYALELSVDDGHGGVAALSFPVHVSDAVCEVPEAVQAIFTQRCAPCHTAASSGGLRLDPAGVSYAALVGMPSSAAACAARVRVIPGDAAGSYLIAKLRGDADICGARMPRNQPALPEEEIATIEAWINALPH